MRVRKRPWKIVAADGHIIASYATQVAAVWNVHKHPSATVEKR